MTTALLGILIFVYMTAGFIARGYSPRLRFLLVSATVAVSLVMYASWHAIEA